MLDPAQTSFAQFPSAGFYAPLQRHPIQTLAGETLGKTPRLGVQRLHSGTPAVLAKQAGLMCVVKGRFRVEWRAASNTAVKARQPTAQPHGPKGVVAQWQMPICGALDFAGGQQKQTEHGLGDFMLRQNKLRDLTDHGEPGAQTVIALSFVKGLEQFGLLDAHQIAGFFLDVPNLEVKKILGRRPVAVLKTRGAGRHAAHPPRRTSKKAHQAICFAQGKCLQDDGFRFPRRHEQSARRRCAGQTGTHRPKRAHTQSYCKYHTRTHRAMSASRFLSNSSARSSGCAFHAGEILLSSSTERRGKACKWNELRPQNYSVN